MAMAAYSEQPACWRGQAGVMRAAHQHDDIELNLTELSPARYLFGGSEVVIPPGRVAAFWAAMPHQLIEAPANDRMHWATLPLPIVLGWGLPSGVITRLLSGQVLLGTGPSVEAFTRWEADLASDDAELRAATVLEIQGGLRRLVRESGGSPPGGRRLERVTAMARFLAARFREPITVRDVAEHVHLHPHYAMSLFREVLDETVNAYLTRCRLAEAQRLLLDSAVPVATVAHLAGFGSVNRFYTAFAAAHGCPPGAYRRQRLAV